MSPKQVPTKFLILSDTHANSDLSPSSFVPQVTLDVAIHCGDLIDGSKLDEYQATLALLASINAPLKLVIPGNHDFALDSRAFGRIRTDSMRAAGGNLDEESLDEVYGRIGQAQQMLASEPGITLLLEERTYQFTLANGAKLTVFASPFTPSTSNSSWAFQYHPDQGHNWCEINSFSTKVDVVITHGPPSGVFDRVDGRRAGCSQLFSAIAKARPRLHCIGHIHEGWGAKRVVWRDHNKTSTDGDLDHFTCIDNERSKVIESLSSLKPSRFDSEKDLAEKRSKNEAYHAAGAVRASLRHEANLFDQSQQTLFVNASIESSDGGSCQLPWVIDIDLDKAN